MDSEIGGTCLRSISWLPRTYNANLIKCSRNIYIIGSTVSSSLEELNRLEIYLFFAQKVQPIEGLLKEGVLILVGWSQEVSAGRPPVACQVVLEPLVV